MTFVLVIAPFGVVHPFDNIVIFAKVICVRLKSLLSNCFLFAVHTQDAANWQWLWLSW